MKTELSPRETEFMRHIVNGLTTTKAAVEMGIGKETAKSYSTTTRMKMGAHTLAQAAVIFYRQQTAGQS